MFVKCPEEYKYFKYRGETYEATTNGIAEVEQRKDGMFYVEKYGIMHRFEPKTEPPRHRFNEGEYSSICRNFMRGEMTSVKLQVNELFVKPFDIQETKQGELLKKNRQTIESAYLDNNELPQVARSIGCADFVLHNPTRTTVNRLQERGIGGANIVFFPTKREAVKGSKQRVEFERYREMILLHCRKRSFDVRQFAEGSTDERYLYYCGFSGTAHLRHKNYVSFELSPYAYKAAGRVFDSIEESESEIRYRTTVRKESITQHRYGHYPKVGTHYRYQPDIVAKYYGKSSGKWGLYGLLTSYPMVEFSDSTMRQKVDVVRHSIMYGAHAIPVSTVNAARQYVAEIVNCRTTGEVAAGLRAAVPLTSPDVFKQYRFYCFQHSGFVLDSGERVFLRSAPHCRNPDLEYRRMKFRRVKRMSPGVDLVLAYDSCGKVTYRSKNCRVLWHKIDPFHMDIMPMTSLIDYSSRYTHYYDLRLHTRPVPESELPRDPEVPAAGPPDIVEIGDLPE